MTTPSEATAEEIDRIARGMMERRYPPGTREDGVDAPLWDDVIREAASGASDGLFLKAWRDKALDAVAWTVQSGMIDRVRREERAQVTGQPMTTPDDELTPEQRERRRIERTGDWPDPNWGPFHRHFASDAIHRDGGPECDQPGRPRRVYVFDPEDLDKHEQHITERVRAEAADEERRRIQRRIENVMRNAPAGNAEQLYAALVDALAAGPVVPAEPCIGNDPTCPCADGDACHYRSYGDSPAWPIPVVPAEPEPAGSVDVNLIRRAIADPGQFTPRGDDYTESIPAWGARAVVIALGQEES